MVVHVAVVLVGNMPPQSLLVVDLNAAQARATSREDAAVGNRTAEERVDLMVAFYDYLFCGNRESSQSNRIVESSTIAPGEGLFRPRASEINGAAPIFNSQPDIPYRPIATDFGYKSHPVDPVSLIAGYPTSVSLPTTT